MHASPPDIGRVDQKKTVIVLIYQIRGLEIVVHLAYSHFRSGEPFERRSKNFFFSHRERRHGAMARSRSTMSTGIGLMFSVRASWSRARIFPASSHAGTTSSLVEARI